MQGSRAETIAFAAADSRGKRQNQHVLTVELTGSSHQVVAMNESHQTEQEALGLPQCAFSGCTETAETVVLFHAEEFEERDDIDAVARWLMEYCGAHAGFVVTHYPNQPRALGPKALRQHWSATMEACND